MTKFVFKPLPLPLPLEVKTEAEEKETAATSATITKHKFSFKQLPPVSANIQRDLLKAVNPANELSVIKQTVEKHAIARQQEQAEAKAEAESFTTTKPAIILDESQSACLEKLKTTKHNVIIGAAGSGKTTVIREYCRWLLDNNLIKDIEDISPAENNRAVLRKNIAFCAFTGMAVARLAEQVPPELFDSCTTIHRLLEYSPVFYENEEGNSSMRYEPRRGRFNPINLDYLVVDETGMLEIELWNNLAQAVFSKTKIIVIGDIYQLPAIFGKSLLGYAMAASNWTTNALTKIHRQAADNPIITTAHDIKDGKFSGSSEDKRVVFYDLGKLSEAEKEKIKTKQLPRDYQWTKNKQAACLKQIVNIINLHYQKGEYNEETDVIITPTNKGLLGQETLNQYISKLLMPDAPRQMVAVSYCDTITLAIGDRMIFTKNNYADGYLNGTPCRLVDIKPNPFYTGAFSYAKSGSGSGSNYSITISEQDLDQFNKSFNQSMKTIEVLDDKEKKQMQASHILTLAYINKNTGKPDQISLRTTGDVAGLQLGYALTCHKCQGSEFRNVFIIVHESQTKLLNREWLYTAVTRAKERAVVLYNNFKGSGLSACLMRQAVPGRTIEEKCKNFSLYQPRLGATENEQPKPLLIEQ